MRRLRDYSLKDWGRLRPLVHAGKTTRYRLTTRRFVRRPSPDLDTVLDRLGQPGDDRPFLATIAFEAPWVIDWQLRALARWLPDRRHLVADNSLDPARARTIRAICASHDVPYLRLPPNPERNPSRSHGMALNWVFRNVLLPSKSRICGFLDHDLIPYRPVAIAEHLRGQPVYGQLHRRDWGWYPWAGYCFFDLEALHGERFDFAPDWFYVLDTGGGNFRRFLHRLDWQRIAWAQMRFATLKRGGAVIGSGILVIDDFFHLGNASLYDEAEAERIACLEENSIADDIELDFVT